MDGRDVTWLSQEFLDAQIITPTVLGLFANDEWDSIAIVPDRRNGAGSLVRIVVAGESVEVALTPPRTPETAHEFQLRLIAELKDFIARSEFGRARGPEWHADDDNEESRPLVVTRPLRPNFAGPAECTMRRRRIRSHTLRLGGRRCHSPRRRN